MTIRGYLRFADVYRDFPDAVRRESEEKF